MNMDLAAPAPATTLEGDLEGDVDGDQEGDADGDLEGDADGVQEGEADGDPAPFAADAADALRFWFFLCLTM